MVGANDVVGLELGTSEAAFVGNGDIVGFGVGSTVGFLVGGSAMVGISGAVAETGAFAVVGTVPAVPVPGVSDGSGSGTAGVNATDGAIVGSF